LTNLAFSIDQFSIITLDSFSGCNRLACFVTAEQWEGLDGGSSELWLNIYLGAGALFGARLTSILQQFAVC